MRFYFKNLGGGRTVEGVSSSVPRSWLNPLIHPHKDFQAMCFIYVLPIIPILYDVMIPTCHLSINSCACELNKVRLALPLTEVSLAWFRDLYKEVPTSNKADNTLLAIIIASKQGWWKIKTWPFYFFKPGHISYWYKNSHSDVCICSVK